MLREESCLGLEGDVLAIRPLPMVQVFDRGSRQAELETLALSVAMSQEKASMCSLAVISRSVLNQTFFRLSNSVLSASRRFLHFAWNPATNLPRAIFCEGASEKKVQISSLRPRAQLLYNLAYILRAVAVGNQQRVFGIHDHQILDAHQRHKLLRAVDIVVAGF